MTRIFVGFALLVSLLATPVASAKKPHKKKAKTVTYKVEYDGHGAWSRHGTYTSPCFSGKSDESATFDWDYTWPRVTLNLKTGTSDAGDNRAKGKFSVVADHSSSGTPCSGPPDPPCDVSGIKYFGSAKDFGHLAMAVQHPSNKLLILPRADTSLFGGDGDTCEIFADDQTDHPVIFQDAIHFGGEEPPIPTSLTALKATIPMKDLLESGKHIINVKDLPQQLPGDEYNCGSAADPNTKCDESQGWTGHITLTKLKK